MSLFSLHWLTAPQRSKSLLHLDCVIHCQTFGEPDAPDDGTSSKSENADGAGEVIDLDQLSMCVPWAMQVVRCNLTPGSQDTLARQSTGKSWKASDKAKGER